MATGRTHCQWQHAGGLLFLKVLDWNKVKVRRFWRNLHWCWLSWSLITAFSNYLTNSNEICSLKYLSKLEQNMHYNQQHLLISSKSNWVTKVFAELTFNPNCTQLSTRTVKVIKMQRFPLTSFFQNVCKILGQHLWADWPSFTISHKLSSDIIIELVLIGLPDGPAIQYLIDF